MALAGVGRLDGAPRPAVSMKPQLPATFALVGTALTAAAAGAYAQDPLLYAAQSAQLGGPSVRIVAADVDGDGDDDLVSNEVQEVRLVRSLGAAGFAPPEELFSSFDSVDFAVADLDSDGDLDLAQLNDIAKVTLLHGDGTGAFAFAAPLLDTPFMELNLDAADLDADGDADLLGLFGTQGAPSWKYALWRGTAAGAFDAPIVEITGSHVSHALGDVTGDGLLDLVYVDQWSPGSTPAVLVIHLGTVSGPLAPYLTSNPFASPTTHALDLALADLDADGTLDVAAGNATGGWVHTARGLGGGAFATASSFWTGASGRGLAVADFDGNGRPDVAAAQQLSATSACAVLWSEPSGSPTIGPLHGIGAVGASNLASGDFDGDGRLDLALASKTAERAAILRGLGARDFADVDFPLLGYPDGRDVECIDWNRDGALDIAALNAAPSVILYAGDGQGTFTPAVSIPTLSPSMRMIAADLNNDGDVDFAQLDYTTQIERALATGPGTYGPATVVATSDWSRDLAAADLNLDGRLDLVASALGGARWFAGDGAGNFAAGVPVVFGGVFGDRVVVADFELNGVPDLAVLERGTPEIRIAKGAGGGAFAAPASVTFGAPLLDFVAGHLDQDNKIDLVATSSADPGVWVAQNDGSGGFLAAVPFALTKGGETPRLFDANADGYADLVYADAALRRPVLAFGNGLAQFASSVALAEGLGLEQIALGDVDADGRCDIVATGYRIGVWRGCAPPPAGTSAYGVGTSGCLGRMGMVAGSEPKLGTAKFDLSISNIGAGHGGFLVLAFAPDVAGTLLQPFGILVHVDLAGSLVYGAHGSGGPTGRWKATIPSDAGLAGLQLAFQAAWPWTPLSPCDPSPFLLSTSRGLSVTLLP